MRSLSHEHSLWVHASRQVWRQGPPQVPVEQLECKTLSACRFSANWSNRYPVPLSVHRLRTKHRQGISSMLLTPGGNWLLTTSNSCPDTAAASIALWDLCSPTATEPVSQATVGEPHENVCLEIVNSAKWGQLTRVAAEAYNVNAEDSRSFMFFVVALNALKNWAPVVERTLPHAMCVDMERGTIDSAAKFGRCSDMTEQHFIAVDPKRRAHCLDLTSQHRVTCVLGCDYQGQQLDYDAVGVMLTPNYIILATTGTVDVFPFEPPDGVRGQVPLAPIARVAFTEDHKFYRVVFSFRSDYTIRMLALAARESSANEPPRYIGPMVLHFDLSVPVFCPGSPPPEASSPWDDASRRPQMVSYHRMSSPTRDEAVSNAWRRMFYFAVGHGGYAVWLQSRHWFPAPSERLMGYSLPTRSSQPYTNLARELFSDAAAGMLTMVQREIVQNATSVAFEQREGVLCLGTLRGDVLVLRYC